MNFLKTTLASVVIGSAIAITSCSDKNALILVEQTEILSQTVSSITSENPQLIASSEVAYAEDKITVDVKLADSLFIVAQISDPLFDYFTACEVKSNLNKNLEAMVNAMTSKEVPMIVTLTDVYGESRSYELTAAKFRRMIKSPLTQLNFNEARDGLLAAFAASEEQFRPEGEAVKAITTSFKGGFFAYNVEFVKASTYKGLTTANLKARALKVLQKRYEKLGTLHPVFMNMYKSMGIDGFHLVYTAGEKSPTLKTTVLLSNL